MVTLVLEHPMSTTSIKLPPELKARVARLAKTTGRSPHSLIVEAVERLTTAEERMQRFVADALAADADIERTGEVFRADDVHAWLDRLASGKKAPRPKPWRR
jgi:predicted transcriptional regulator